MAVTSTLYNSALNGGRTSRYGDAVMVVMDGLAFMTTAQDLQQASSWSRSRQSSGSAHKDRMTFAGRFETMLARNGSGCATKGSNRVLGQIVKVMKQNGMDILEWQVPPNIFEDMEAKKSGGR